MTHQQRPIERVLLTGGSGLVGRVLAPMLAEKFEVTHFEMRDPADGLPWIEGDLLDSGAVGEACRGMDAVVHVAALHGRTWAEAGDEASFRINVEGTRNVLEGAANAGVQRLVFTSSIWATGHGQDPPYLPIDEELPRQPRELYGLTKILGEQMCRYYTANHGLSTIALRPGGIRPADTYSAGSPDYLGGAVDVRDVAQGHFLAVQAPSDIRSDVFLITADSPLCEIDPAAYRADPARALERVLPGAAARIAEAGFELRPDLEWFTIEKARRALGYEPQYNFSL